MFTDDFDFTGVPHDDFIAACHDEGIVSGCGQVVHRFGWIVAPCVQSLAVASAESRICDTQLDLVGDPSLFTFGFVARMIAVIRELESMTAACMPAAASDEGSVKGIEVCKAGVEGDHGM